MKKSGIQKTSSSVLLVVFLAVLGLVFVFIQGTDQNLRAFAKKSTQNTNVPLPIPVQTTIVIPPDPETAPWITLENTSLGISFAYPPTHEILKKQQDKVELGFSNFPYITVTSHPILYNEKNLCTKGVMIFPCISSITWGQVYPVEHLLIGTIEAKSYYVTTGISTSYHVVTLNNPPVQFASYVTPGNLDRTFQQLLSTIRVTDR